MTPSLPTLPLSQLGGPGKGQFKYDFIIVGGGTAGCVLASRLSLLPGSPTVLLLERGGSDRGWMSSTPLMSTSWQMDEKKCSSIPTVPQQGLDGRVCDMLGGKILGGASTFNSSLYTRGLPSEFNIWASQFDLPSWSFSKLLPYFISSQNHRPNSSPIADLLPPSNTASAYTGADGPWATTNPSVFTYPSSKHFVVARAGFGEGLKIGLGALVHKLDLDHDGTCKGVWFSEDGKPESTLLHASCCQETILTSGTVFSTQLLLLSGIGPKAELEELHITCLVDLPDVGRGLADHLSVYLPYTVPITDSLDRLENSPLHAIKQIASFALFRTGDFTFQGSQTAIMISSTHIPEILSEHSPYSKERPLWTSSLAEEEVPNLEILPLPFRFHSSMDDGKPDGKTPDLRKGKYNKSVGYLSPISILVRPKSTGTIKLKSKDPREIPACDPGFLTDPADLPVLIQGLRLAAKVVDGMIAGGYDVKPIEKNNPFAFGKECSDDELKAYVKKWAVPAYHMSSTLRMSGQENDGVVDGCLRVKGCKGLRVADASVFPTILAVHTQAPVVVVAEKCATMIGEEWSKASH
ncbi:Glucose dehydrogenase/choline dehydrogenase/mandelonitrile lyase (GMC oxidoreductase family) [Phaffia rhodozyma]|uniref:Glucose dehydrogenase/choline dehydrogenase/mandelonitrile lyase (GMC oxidoreductase family) n=1 Tax=Phaffia rhodozyma TaxID=264483 RepID=A0A0F7SJZ1_PHARH|nr:Glucose dehydrogenase/choline dehydrogenase/mandelonitrile lyase (GMC oxidoreductase family) [Phaffia rhodozyma]